MNIYLDAVSSGAAEVEHSSKWTFLSKVQVPTVAYMSKST